MDPILGSSLIFVIVAPSRGPPFLKRHDKRKTMKFLATYVNKTVLYLLLPSLEVVAYVRGRSNSVRFLAIVAKLID